MQHISSARSKSSLKTLAYAALLWGMIHTSYATSATGDTTLVTHITGDTIGNLTIDPISPPILYDRLNSEPDCTVLYGYSTPISVYWSDPSDPNNPQITPTESKISVELSFTSEHYDPSAPTSEYCCGSTCMGQSGHPTTPIAYLELQNKPAGVDPAQVRIPFTLIYQPCGADPLNRSMVPTVTYFDPRDPNPTPGQTETALISPNAIDPSSGEFRPCSEDLNNQSFFCAFSEEACKGGNGNPYSPGQLTITPYYFYTSGKLQYPGIYSDTITVTATASDVFGH